MKTLNDFDQLVAPIVGVPNIELSPDEKELARNLKDRFMSIEQWEDEVIFNAMKQLMQERNVRMPVFYKIISGKESGLPLPQVLEIIGKEKVLQRLQKLV